MKNDSLYLLAVRGDLEKIKKRIAAGESPNVRHVRHPGVPGILPVHAAARRGHIDIVEYLIGLVEDPTEAAVQLSQCAGHAIYEQRVDALVEIVALGAVISPDDANFYWIKSVEMLDVILGSGFDINSIDRNGETLLFQAAYHARKDVFEELIGRGADVNRAPSDGYTALHYAASQGRRTMAKMLIAAGADPTARTCGRRTAFDIAMQHCISIAAMFDPRGNEPAAPAI